MRNGADDIFKTTSWKIALAALKSPAGGCCGFKFDIARWLAKMPLRE
jgi:hypothetical protein